MAYFQSKESVPEKQYSDPEENETEYDDGFDELSEPEEEVPELTSEEKAQRKKDRIRLAFGAGNLFGVIAGTVLILVLMTMIFSMVHFVITDMSRNFSLFQTNF